MVGASADEVREADLTISMEADNLAMRGEQVHARFTVLDVKRPELPELNEEFLHRLGVRSEEELREQLRRGLERQVEYEQRQATRQQVLDRITESADWELPEELLRKQVENAMRREILELQQAGFTTAQIRAREAELRQKSLSTTERNLKQHFILDRIAEREKIEVSGAEIDAHIAMMALQSGENPRRVRSRLVKSGLIENLEAQIRERKAVDVILSSAKFVDRPLPPFADRNVEGVNRSICGEIPDTEVSVAEEAEA
jgi:trigger factor